MIRTVRTPTSCVAILLTALVLSACNGTSPAALETPAAATTRLVAGPNIGPGPAITSPATAAGLMRAVCGSTVPAKAAAANGFALNTSFGTFYHQQLDLSIKHRSDRCSMVFASNASLAEVERALAAAPASGVIRQPHLTKPRTAIFGANYGAAS